MEENLKDNPPIAVNETEQVDNAVKYRREYGWSLDKSAEKAGITTSKLNRYF